MREILFRGKTTSGKWVEGYVVKGANTYIIPLNNVKGIVVSVCGNLGVFADKVIPETVGQYTGLTDNNGKKIFEGDIVQCYFADGYKEKGTIRWSNQDVRFSFVPLDGKYNWGIDDTDKFEIIGNIHDNPELLKGE